MSSISFLLPGIVVDVEDEGAICFTFFFFFSFLSSSSSSSWSRCATWVGILLFFLAGDINGWDEDDDETPTTVLKKESDNKDSFAWNVIGAEATFSSSVSL